MIEDGGVVKLNKRRLKVIVAALVNLFLITMLILYFVSGTERVILSILLPAAVHISLCGTLLFFVYWNRDINI